MKQQRLLSGEQALFASICWQRSVLETQLLVDDAAFL